MRKIALGFVIILSGCISANITSNKAPDFNEKIGRLYIVVRGSDNAKHFFDSFNNYLDQSLKSKGVETSYHYFGPLSLESEEDVDNKIKEFGPKLLMTIQQTESRNTIHRHETSLTTTNTGASFDIRLIRPDSKSTMWRANLSSFASYGLSGSAKSSVDKLIEKLTTDGLLPRTGNNK
ncbi:hypothetical protein QQ008_24720 [Fulvivirgaceae bacterium BMA10]|uniref:DUF4136 domain-containing protein n=1 Tax=Splendidivirga corallicola TaxID=3051826 RepID=A0ABT8KV15_9BACT|nr:hypothetical protein [Fulvivirgaceae bacterium BMA10]